MAATNTTRYRCIQQFNVSCIHSLFHYQDTQYQF